MLIDRSTSAASLEASFRRLHVKADATGRQLTMIAIGAPLMAVTLALGSAIFASRQPASAADIRLATLLSPPNCQTALIRAVHKLYADHPTRHQLPKASWSICRASHDDKPGAGLVLGTAVGYAYRLPR